MSDVPLDDYLNALNRLIRPIRSAALPRTLEPMRALLAALGDPQQRIEVIMVAGSTGKGSTAWKLANQLPRSTGLYLSPHLHSFRERIRIDGQMIARADFSALANRVMAAAARIGLRPSTFEAATALAYLYFAERGIDRAVMEIGLGGRFDAVNVTTARLAVIAPIEREHAGMLGGSLEAIAWHKAGIIPAGGVAISAPQDPLVQGVLEAETRSKGARLVLAIDLVSAALDVFGLPTAARPIPPFPGRLETVRRTARGGEQTIIIDGGHTPLAARFVRDQALADVRTARIVIGMLRDKDAAGFASAFDQRGWIVEWIDTPGSRGRSAHDLAAACPLRSARSVIGSTLDAALDHADESPILITGSLRLAAAAREQLGLVDADLLAEAQATRALFDGADYHHRLGDPPGSR